MRLRHGWIVATLIVTGLVLPACTRTSGEEAGGEPDTATVEPIEGTDVARVTLSPDAARRLDIQTAPVRPFLEGDGGKQRAVIPYAAVLYDPNGDTWTYTSPEPLVFIRYPIRVAQIDGSEAVLSSGPPLGTEVVTVGASELLGAEYGVGEE